MSTQSDVERFIPGTNVVYDNEIYTCLFFLKEVSKKRYGFNSESLDEKSCMSESA